jgi:dihydrolipoamide dehydrogenase
MIATEIAVAGAGPGGYAAAFLAADVGLSATLIDPEPDPGGVCVDRGCIPSRALLHVARLLHEAREAKAWGSRSASRPSTWPGCGGSRIRSSRG